MLQSNSQEKKESIKVDVNVNPDKAKKFINELVNLLNKYGLDGINICNETIIQINLIDLMEYRVTPIQQRGNTIETNRDSLINNIIK